MPELDLLIRGGTVVDGTGLPAVHRRRRRARRPDRRQVGRARRRWRRPRPSTPTACCVTPGFVDIHTHYDAQLHWEPTASPSSWHGVTTVITGNCGFSLSPHAPTTSPWLLRDAQPGRGHVARRRWRPASTFAGGGTARLPRRPRRPPRRERRPARRPLARCAATCMGDDAGDADRDRRRDRGDAGARARRAATRVRSASRRSQLEMHVDQRRHPVPSNLAAPDELVALASVFADRAHGVDRVHHPQQPRGPRRRRPRADARDVRGVGQADERQPDREPADAGRRVEARASSSSTRRAPPGTAVHPQSQLQQMQVFFALHDTFLFDEMAAFREVLTAGDRREALLRDPDGARPDARAPSSDTDGPRARLHLGRGEGRARRRPSRVGRAAPSPSSRASWGVDPFDAFLDASLAEELRHDVHARRIARRRRPRRTTEEVVAHPASLPGSSDAGAHLTQLLRRRLLDPVAQRVRARRRSRSRKPCARLATIPAPALRLRRPRRGWAPARAPISWCGTRARSGLGATRWVGGLPRGRRPLRRRRRPGYRALVVNGEVVRRDGADTGARPGRVLRPGTVADV